EKLAREDVEEIERSTEGAVAAHIRSSQNTGSALDVTILAVSRLAQNGNDAATASLRRVRELWEESLRGHTRDETALQIVLLVSDGLYFNAVLDLNAVPSPRVEGADLDKLIAAVVAATT
ncbi:TetR/AcrR family transcriptional regulator, partial [Microbacterium sp. Kw_RZR3]